MKKPVWLKSSYLKALLSHAVSRVLTGNSEIQSDGSNVLIHSTDGLGDAILRLSIVKALAKKHGESKVWVLTRPASQFLYETLGLNTILYTDQCRTGVLKRLKLIRMLQSMSFGTAYVLDFRLNENLIELVESRVKIGFSREPGSTVSWLPSYTIKVVHPGYVGDALRSLCKSAGISPSVMDNTKLLVHNPEREIGDNTDYKTNLLIGVAVGASNKSKMMRVSNLATILNSVKKELPSANFTLLGFGSREEKYAATLEALYSSNQGDVLDNKVSAFELKELIDKVHECDLLIGFDSALYNLAFSLKKPTLCLSYGDQSVLHSKPWVRVVRGSGNEWGRPDRFGCAGVNSISPTDVVIAIKELLDYYREYEKDSR